MDASFPSELTLLVLRIGFLLLLWLLVFAIVYAMRSELFGARVRKLPPGAQISPTVDDGILAAGIAAPAAPVAPAPHYGSGTYGDRPYPDEALTDLFGTVGGSDAPAPDDAVTELVGSLDYVRPTSSNAPANPAPPAPVASPTRLVITSGSRAGTTIALGNEPLTIGRSSDSGLIIQDDYTSTHHARLLLWGEEWVVQDLDSTNGTFVNGSRVTVPTPVPPGAEVRIGATSFELRR